MSFLITPKGCNVKKNKKKALIKTFHLFLTLLNQNRLKRSEQGDFWGFSDISP